MNKEQRNVYLSKWRKINRLLGDLLKREEHENVMATETDMDIDNDNNNGACHMHSDDSNPIPNSDILGDASSSETN